MVEVGAGMVVAYQVVATYQVVVAYKLRLLVVVTDVVSLIC